MAIKKMEQGDCRFRKKKKRKTKKTIWCRR